MSKEISLLNHRTHVLLPMAVANKMTKPFAPCKDMDVIIDISYSYGAPDNVLQESLMEIKRIVDANQFRSHHS